MNRLTRLLLIAAIPLTLGAVGWGWFTGPARAAHAIAPWQATWWPSALGLSGFDIDPYPASPPASPLRAGEALHALLRPFGQEMPVGLATVTPERFDSAWTPAVRATLTEQVGPLTPDGLGGRLRRAMADSIGAPILRAIDNMPFHGRAGRFAVVGSLRSADMVGARYATTRPTGTSPALSPSTAGLSSEAVTDMAAAWMLTAIYQQGVGRPRALIGSLTQGAWAMGLWARSTPDMPSLAEAGAWGDVFVTELIAAFERGNDQAYAQRMEERWTTLRQDVASQEAAPSPLISPSAALAHHADRALPGHAPLAARWYQHVIQRVAATCGRGAAPTQSLASLPGMAAVPLWVREEWEEALTPPAGRWAAQRWCVAVLRTPPWQLISAP